MGEAIPVGIVDMLRARRQASLAFVKHFESVVRPSVEAQLDSEASAIPYSITVQAGQSPDSRVIEVMTSSSLLTNVQQAIRDDVSQKFAEYSRGVQVEFTTGVVDSI